ncbi:hypothetical protein MMC12_006272 [Toensbergia leucococca]|nr:hypothetical protein [Toensbergia leucococca]
MRDSTLSGKTLNEEAQDLSCRNTTDSFGAFPGDIWSLSKLKTGEQFPSYVNNQDSLFSNDIWSKTAELDNWAMSSANSEEKLEEVLPDKEGEGTSHHPPPPKPSFSTAHEVAFVAVVCSAQLMTQASFGQVLAPLHVIGDAFKAQNTGQLVWYPAAYSLTVGTFILVAGRLGDIFGHKRLFIIGYLWFALWSLIAGLSVYSGSQIFFDICRALQGLGPALLMPNALALFGRTYPPGRRKEMLFALFGATAPSGFVVGAVFSALLAEKAWWPWAFWCTAITCCVLAASAFFVIPAPPEHFLIKKGNRHFDYIGSVTGVCGLVLFNLAWNQAPSVGWNSPKAYVLLLFGMLFLAAFFTAERKVATPLIPRDLLLRKVGFILGCIALGWSSFGIWIYYLCQFIEVLRGYSPLSLSAQVVPCALSGICASALTGFLLSKLGTPYIMVIAMVSFCVANILVATMPIDQSYWIQTFLTAIIAPFGMDMSFPAATIMLSNFVGPQHQGVAASLVTTVVNYSISIGLGIAGTVEVHVNRGGEDILRGYRGAEYAAIGLSGMGILLSLIFAITHEPKK